MLQATRLAAAVGAFSLAFAPSAVSGQVVVNEILASNTFTNFDDVGRAEDWIELKNLGSTAVDLEGYYLTDDAGVPLKWSFPDGVSIPPRGYLLVWLSGNNRFVPPSDAIESGRVLAFEPLFIREEDEWRYLVADPGEAGPPAGWSDRLFDDGAWSRGRSGFGYGDEDDFTELPVDTGAVFTRREFDIDDPEALTNIVLRIDYDDGFVAYLNGRRVASSGASSGEPDFSSIATGKHEAGTFELFDLTSFTGELVPGRNVLAVVGLNDIPSSDMSLVAELGVVPLSLHTNFRLDRRGEFIGLYAPDRTQIDALVYGEQTEDHSFGRSPDGTGEFAYFLTPTPLRANTSRPFDEPLADRVTFSPDPGIYFGGSVNVSLEAGLSELTEIRYTTDGTAPSASSTRYIAPITIRQGTSFRAAGFVEGERATRVVAASYFLNETYQLPIMSITMDPDDFATVHNSVGARGRGSEREGFMEYFEGGRQAIGVGFGLRLHGGAGRGGDFNTKKAYKAYFRGVYGATKLRHRIIPETPVDEFDKLVLRSGFNDSFRTNGRAAYIRDELIRDLHQDMGGFAASGSWCMLYVNQRFRGLYNIVERMDEDFLSSYFEGEDWDVIKTGNDVLVGSRDEWNAMRDFIARNDMRNPALYEQALELIDVDNFTSYMLVNMWAQNHDWPHNNWYAARRREPGSKWMFLSWDAEFGVGLIPSGYTADTFDFVFTRNGYHREVLENLLQNDDYRAYFIGEVAFHLENALDTSNVLQRIEELHSVVFGDMLYELEQFNRSVSSWENNIQAMRSFANGRPGAFWPFVANSARFDFDGLAPPRVTSVRPSTVTNTGDIELSIEGTGFESGLTVTLNGIGAQTAYESSDSARVVLPLAAEIAGDVVVGVRNPNGTRSEATGVLRVELPVPSVSSIDPAEGDERGGELVTITGRDFVDGATVLFGETAAPFVQVSPGGGLLRQATIVARTPPGSGEVAVTVVNQRPAVLPSEDALPFRYVRAKLFLRGDVNNDGAVDVSDAISVLGFLFSGGEEPPCLAAADANRSLSVDLSDAVAILARLFRGAAPLAPPHPGCGASESAGELPCEDSNCAE